MAIVWKICFAGFFLTATLAIIASADSPSEVRDCNKNSLACGWQVYENFSRKYLYHIKNSCECRANQKCVKDYEDVAKNVFVYTCR